MHTLDEALEWGADDGTAETRKAIQERANAVMAGETWTIIDGYDLGRCIIDPYYARRV